MLLFCDGFDHYAMVTNSSGSVVSPQLIKWDSYAVAGSNSNLIEVASGLGRSSTGDSLTGGLLITGCYSPTPPGKYLRKNLNTNAATLYVGFAFNCPFYSTGGGGGPTVNSDTVILEFTDVGTAQVDLRLTPSGQFYFTRNGTALGSHSTSLLPTSQWHYIEVGITFNGSTGTAQLKVDAVSWLNLTGLNTSNSGNAYANQVALSSAAASSSLNNSDVYFDDLYVCDGTTSYNNSFLGDVRVRSLRPAANGTYTAFTGSAAAWAASTAYALGTTILDSNGNLQRVTSISGTGTSGSGSHPTWSSTTGVTTTDNPGANQVVWTCLGSPSAYEYVNEPDVDYDSSYLTDATPGDECSFTFPTTTGSQVFAVAVQMISRKDDAGTRTIRSITKSGGTTADDGVDKALSTSYACATGFFPTDPNTGVAWTMSGVNAAEFGVKTTA